jgi:hypothetical protein
MIWRDILLHLQDRNATYTLKTKAGCSSKTLVSTYQTTRYHNKDDDKKGKHIFSVNWAKEYKS